MIGHFHNNIRYFLLLVKYLSHDYIQSEQENKYGGDVTVWELKEIVNYASVNAKRPKFIKYFYSNGVNAL